MHLDLPTLMTMESFVAACVGAVLLVVWWQHRTVAALGLWGIAKFFVAGGIFCLMLGWAVHQPALTALGGVMLALAQGLMWKAARSFDARPAPLALALLGAAIVATGNMIPAVREFAGSLCLAVNSTYLLATAGSLWAGRHEQLAARWPFIILIGVHVTVLLTGAFSTMNGSSSQDQVPPVMSLFGFIHFESIIFAVGTAVFMLALVKERNEAAGMRAARIDPLTGIANRAGFTEKAVRVVERCQREGVEVSVMMFDLDRFKLVNDTHGHAVGDTVIRKFCELAAAGLRATDVFGRIGGEEFAAVLPASSIEAAYVRAERIRTSFAANCRFLADRQVNATVSCGLASNENGERTLDALLQEADGALYCAKTEGRNRVKRAAPAKPDDSRSTVIRVA